MFTKIVNHRMFSIIVFFSGLVFTLYTYIIPEKDNSAINQISIFGTYLSIYGIILAYVQILSLRQVAIQTQAAVEKSSTAIQKVLSVSELSKVKKLIEEIQLYLHNDNFNGSVIRMNDLKENLIQNKYIPQLSKQTGSKTYKVVITNTGLDINTLNDKVSEPSTVIDKSVIMRNLEIAKSTILEFENELKYKSND